MFTDILPNSARICCTLKTLFEDTIAMETIANGINANNEHEIIEETLNNIPIPSPILQIENIPTTTDDLGLGNINAMRITDD